MSKEAYLSFKDYIENTKGAVLLFVLTNARGQEVTRQVVEYKDFGMTTSNSYTAKFVVDELLSAKMIPGAYTLYMYIGIPASSASSLTKLTPDDYTLDKCLTENGVKIRVRGGIKEPSVGVNDIGG